MTIHLKRVYDKPSAEDGARILVERLWPRGVSKTRASIELWAKEVAPSTDLRKWFDHDPDRWAEFKRRYYAELDTRPEAVRELVDRMRQGDITFVFASSELRWNSAVALKEYVGQRADV